MFVEIARDEIGNRWRLAGLGPVPGPERISHDANALGHAFRVESLGHGDERHAAGSQQFDRGRRTRAFLG